jgi:hypothetical protein
VELLRSPGKKLKPFYIPEVLKTLGIINYKPALPVVNELIEDPKKYGNWSRFIPGVFYRYVRRRIVSVAKRTKDRLEQSSSSSIEDSSRAGSSSLDETEMFPLIYGLWRLLAVAEERAAQKELAGNLEYLGRHNFIIYYFESQPLLKHLSPSMLNLRAHFTGLGGLEIPQAFADSYTLEKMKTCSYFLSENFHYHLPDDARALLLLSSAPSRTDIFSIDSGEGLKNTHLIDLITSKEDIGYHNYYIRQYWDDIFKFWISRNKGLRVVARTSDITEIISLNHYLKFKKNIFSWTNAVRGIRRDISGTSVPRGFFLHSVIKPKIISLRRNPFKRTRMSGDFLLKQKKGGGHG